MYVPSKEQPSGDERVLQGWIVGYETALTRHGHPSEHRPFMDWVEKRRSDLKRSTDWYGGKMLSDAAGDHAAVFTQIR